MISGTRSPISAEDTHLHCTFATIPLRQVDSWAMQPASRTQGDPALVDLQASLQERGQVLPVAVVRNGARYMLADGHRRVHAARALGWTTIWGQIYLDFCVDTIADLAALMNLERRHYGLSDFLEGVRQGVVEPSAMLPQLPPRYRGKYQQWLDNVPTDEIAPLLAALQTPYSIEQAGSVARYLGWPRKRRVDILRWMATLGPGSTARVRHWVRAGIPRARLEQAIEKGAGIW
jgi:hypothetical protein